MNEFFKKIIFEIFEFFKQSLKIDLKIDEIVFFHFQIAKLINCSKTTIEIVVHVTQIFDNVFDDSVWILEFLTKTRFQMMQRLIINQILHIFDSNVFDRKKIDVFLQFAFNFQRLVINSKFVFFSKFVRIK